MGQADNPGRFRSCFGPVDLDPRGEAPADPTKCQAQAFEEPQRSKRLKISRRMAYNEKTKAKDGKEGKDGKDGHFDVQIEVFSPSTDSHFLCEVCW